MTSTPLPHPLPPATPTLHWSQWLCPGPQRVFTADEMRRAGDQPWPRFLDLYVLINFATLIAGMLIAVPPETRWWAGSLAAAVTLMAMPVAHALWRLPTRRRLNWAFALPGIALVVMGLVAHGQSPAIKSAIVLVCMSCLVLASMMWWVITTLRVRQIESRLRELDDQQRHLQLARRLATAQVQPHFLFNTLASLQHWVDTGDVRAGPLLRSFTGYLRATLPMFEHESIALDDELALVRNYLEIMQARMGARLRWEVSGCAELATLPVPPGTLLTLVENAITHGIEPSLRGGHIELSARCTDGQARIEVVDDGAGLPAGSPAAAEGIGLGNTRERLRSQYGSAASLTLHGSGAGFTARIVIDLEGRPA